jgi:hypothetical protein
MIILGGAGSEIVGVAGMIILRAVGMVIISLARWGNHPHHPGWCGGVRHPGSCGNENRHPGRCGDGDGGMKVDVVHENRIFPIRGFGFAIRELFTRRRLCRT